MLQSEELASKTMANKRLINVMYHNNFSLRLFNDAFNYSGYTPSNDRMESEKLILENAERNGCDLI
jgi:hypothetical protein